LVQFTASAELRIEIEEARELLSHALPKAVMSLASSSVRWMNRRSSPAFPLVRRHWGVETSHQILDTAFAEDDHPWVEAHPRAALSVAILRRTAYTLLTLFRSVTQRSEERRQVPWKRLMRDVLFTLVTTTRGTARRFTQTQHRRALLKKS
jgi:hypothetical protein